MTSRELSHPRPQPEEASDPAPEQPRSPSFYDSALSPEELGDLLAHRDAPAIEPELDCVRVATRRILASLQSDAEQLTASQFRLMSQAVFSGARTIAHLLRDRPNPSEQEDLKVALAIVRSLRDMLGEKELDL